MYDFSDVVALGQVFIYMLILPEAQMGKALLRYNNQCRFGHRTALDRRLPSLSVFNP